MEDLLEKEMDILERDTNAKLIEREKKDVPLSQVEHFVQHEKNGSAGNFHVLRKASNKGAFALEADAHQGVICYRKVNNVRYLNKFLEAVNLSLKSGGRFIGCVETDHQIKLRLRRKYPAVVCYPWFFLHFVVRRVIPKWWITKKAYFNITRGKNRVISLTEMLGRLVSCGFEIQSIKHIDGVTWFSVCKVEKPDFNLNPTYGPLVRLKRVGLGGKLINVYKFRTMHPYAEYLQDYVYQLNNLKNGGKIEDDMRITGWGKFMRKLWLDEQPMWLNFLKRELKLVGVRPLSKHYFGLYPEEMQEMRIRFKPGLIPPFYYDMPQTFDEIVESERRYLEAYEMQPVRTDIRYFFGAMKNIIIKRARSG